MVAVTVLILATFTFSTGLSQLLPDPAQYPPFPEDCPYLRFRSKNSSNVAVYPVYNKTTIITTEASPATRPTAVIPIKSLDAVYVMANSPFTCEGLEDGYYADVYYNCDFFHNCQFFFTADGKKYAQRSVFECGPGTKFNQFARICDFAENVFCDPLAVQEIITKQLTPPTSGQSYSEPISASTFRCIAGQHKDGFYFADEGTNCKTYHR